MATRTTPVDTRRGMQKGADRSADDRAREQLLTGIPVVERRLPLAGVSTAVLEAGTGSPMILLHGPGEFAAKWMRVIPDLAARHRVIVPDLPGHGASEVTAGALTADRVLAWLEALIERTCVSPPALVGHLLGGAIAARFAVGHTNLSHLVLVNSMGLGRFRPAPQFALALITFLARPTERSSDRLWQRCTVDLDRMREQMGERWDAFATYYLDRARTPGTGAVLRTLMGQVGVPTIPASALEQIRVPTTLVWGRHDVGMRLRIAEDAHARYGWPLEVIDDAANDPILEQPEAFVEALRHALDGQVTETRR